MAKRGPKTLTGAFRKANTGDGRRKTELEKFVDREAFPSKSKKRR